MRSVKLEELPGLEAANDLDHLVHTLAATRQGHTGNFEILGPGRDSHAKAQPVVTEHSQGHGLLRHQHRIAHGQFDDKGGEAKALGHRRQGGGQDHGLDEGFAIEEFPVAIGGVGILAIRDLGVRDAVGDRKRCIARLLRGNRQGDVVLRCAHGLGQGKSHEYPFLAEGNATTGGRIRGARPDRERAVVGTQVKKSRGMIA